MLIFVLDSIENVVGYGKNAGHYKSGLYGKGFKTNSMIWAILNTSSAKFNIFNFDKS